MMPSTSYEKQQSKAFWVAVVAGLIYGFGFRLTLYLFAHSSGQPRSSWYPDEMWVMTAGFLLGVPFVMGWITIWTAGSDGRKHYALWLMFPWIGIVLGYGVALIAHLEGAICIIFAAPVQLFLASMGGLTAGVVLRNRHQRGGATTLCLAIMPLLIAGVEMQTTGPLQRRTVNTEIRIHATAETVWRNIERVPPIQRAELRPTWAHAIGFPLPVEATLDHEGVGGVRHASFEHGLLFIETIDAWDPGRRIAFTIAADTAHIPPTTLDEHVTIGGRFFDVLDGEYRLEPLPGGDILLHLSSHERLSTDFNPYAALWSDAVMRNLQTGILRVVKNRCERAATLPTDLHPATLAR